MLTVNMGLWVKLTVENTVMVNVNRKRVIMGKVNHEKCDYG